MSMVKWKGWKTKKSKEQAKLLEMNLISTIHPHTHTHIHPKNVFLRAVQSLFISRKNHEMSQYCGAKGDGDEKEETLLLLLVYFRWLIFFYFILEQQLRVE
jgi:hypothetical protein